MKIMVIDRTVNENTTRTFGANGYSTLAKHLMSEFVNQGAFFLSAFGVSAEDAEAAGWHPTHREFSSACDGWNRFVATKGRIYKTENQKLVDINELLFKV